MIFGIDVSGWNPGLDYDEMHKGGVRFLITKLTQNTASVTALAETHILNARRLGWRVLAYHWADPLYNDLQQADHFNRYLDKYKIRAAMVDAEQYWADWAEFYAMIRGTGTITKFLDPRRISDNCRNMIRILESRGFLARPYTRASFVTERAPIMWEWIKPMNGWWAHYPYKPGRLYARWEDLHPGGIYHPGIPAPSLPQGTTWKLWQFTGDKFILPGTGGIPIDVNIFPGTMEELDQYAYGEPQPPTQEPEPEIPPTGEPMIKFKVLINDLRIREIPGTAADIKVLGYRQAGQEVIATEIKVLSGESVWVKDERGWSAIVHGDTKYMQ